MTKVGQHDGPGHGRVPLTAFAKLSPSAAAACRERSFPWPSTPMIWMDLEMTGLDPEDNVIIEIATLVTDSELQVLAEVGFCHSSR